MIQRRTDGFSDDGLSYSVATDFDKQLGQALSEIETRTKNPRYIPGSSIPNPDAPDLLKREILDPIIQAKAAYEGQTQPRGGSMNRNLLPNIVKSGADIYNHDPVSGSLTLIHPGPIKQDNRLTDFRLGRLKQQAAQLNDLRNNPVKMGMSGLKAEDIDAQLKAIDQEASGLFNPAPAAVAAPNDLLSSGINIIGTPENNKFTAGGANIVGTATNNHFVSPSRPILPGQVGSKEVVKPLKDGRKAVFNTDTKQFIRYAP